MRGKYLCRLKSNRRSERLKAWAELPQQPEASQNVLRNSDRVQLARILSAEEDDGVYRWGCDILREYSSCCCSARGHGPVGFDAEGRANELNHWLWSEFRKVSAVFQASEHGYSRRDADAVQSLARRLGIKEYPHVNFHPLPLHKDGWQQLVTYGAYETIGLVGRLSLFGERAVALLQHGQARFRFPRQNRPPSRNSRSKAMREYYCLEEYENGEVINHYRTQDRNGVRTDYGIVQRYPCRLGTHWVTIVLCSGLSALGTQAAAYWAAIDSGLFHDPSSRNPIPLPDSVHPDSCLEALIRASGDSGAPIWRPCEIDLMELYVDHYRWSPEERGWDDIQRHVFEIRVRDGEPLEVRIDDQKARLHAGSQNFNLVTTLVLTAARSRDNSVAVQDLAQNRAIWDGKRLTSTKVKQRLHNLRSTLMDTLKVDNRITVEADIKVTEA